MDREEIKKIANDFYDFFETYYSLPRELQGLQRIYPNLSDLQDSFWYYHISYNQALEIYFGAKHANIYINGISKNVVDTITKNVNTIKDSIFVTEKNYAYIDLYNIELRKISYDFINPIKEILMQLA
jgi:hypothetical protein